MIEAYLVGYEPKVCNLHLKGLLVVIWITMFCHSSHIKDRKFNVFEFLNVHHFGMQNLTNQLTSALYRPKRHYKILRVYHPNLAIYLTSFHLLFIYILFSLSPLLIGLLLVHLSNLNCLYFENLFLYLSQKFLHYCTDFDRNYILLPKCRYQKL